MTTDTGQISNAFQAFLSEAPEFAQAWGACTQTLAKASALDAKTRALAYLSVLAALNRVSGIPYHVTALKQMGASRDEVISAVLLGLPAAGSVVTQALPAALQAYDDA